MGAHKRREELARLHSLLDFNGDGVISLQEFDDFGFAMDPKWARDRSLASMKAMDADNSKGVDEDEFVLFYMKQLQNKNDEQFKAGVKKLEVFAEKARRTREAQDKDGGALDSRVRARMLHEVHEQMDLDSSGRLNLEEFHAFGSMFDRNWTRAKAEAAMEHMDQNKDGGVDVNEFVNFYLNLLEARSDAKFKEGVEKMLLTCAQVQGHRSRRVLGACS